MKTKVIARNQQEIVDQATPSASLIAVSLDLPGIKMLKTLSEADMQAMIANALRSRPLVRHLDILAGNYKCTEVIVSAPGLNKISSGMENVIERVSTALAETWFSRPNVVGMKLRTEAGPGGTFLVGTVTLLIADKAKGKAADKDAEDTEDKNFDPSFVLYYQPIR